MQGSKRIKKPDLGNTLWPHTDPDNTQCPLSWKRHLLKSFPKCHNRFHLFAVCILHMEISWEMRTAGSTEVLVHMEGHRPHMLTYLKRK